MATRTTITLRDKDYELLESFKDYLDMPTSQTMSVILQVAKIIKEEQDAGNEILIRDKKTGKEKKSLAVNFS